MRKFIKIISLLLCFCMVSAFGFGCSPKGSGGTKEEMQRLLIDAEKLSGIKYDISSYADIVDAIHVVQTEMGITGTTALEASTTIQGSVAANTPLVR